MKMQPCVAALWFVQTTSEQPSLSPLSPALPECAAAPACAAGPVASTAPTHTKVRNVCVFVCIQNKSITFVKVVSIVKYKN